MRRTDEISDVNLMRNLHLNLTNSIHYKKTTPKKKIKYIAQLLTVMDTYKTQFLLGNLPDLPELC